jgi:hypothetical protein
LPTGVKLDDLDLIKKVEDSSALLDLRTVYNMAIADKRNLVELEVIGSEGNVLQDMGCEPVRISLFGEMMGTESRSYIERLVNKFNTHKPIEFSSDISNIPEISKVIMEQFCVQEVAGSPSRYKYYIILREYKDSKTSGADAGAVAAPPALTDLAKQQVESEAKGAAQAAEKQVESEAKGAAQAAEKQVESEAKGAAQAAEKQVESEDAPT